MAALFFFIAALGAIAGAVGVVTLRNSFYAVLALVCHLLSLAALFLLLRAQFVAAAQVIVYAGAVMVLYVFVVSYVSEGPFQSTPGAVTGAGRAMAYLFAGLLAAELLVAMLGNGLEAIGHDGAQYDPGFGTPAGIGKLLLTKFLFPFEAASFLLLIAAVGAVVLARRRGGGIDPSHRPVISVMEMVRDERLGTMAETVNAGTNEPAVGAAAPLGAGGDTASDGREAGW
ncbi:MAG: NADH-quinone oxidoreductase subunit [Solirubrobacteraceae bacterium]|nr:NADH-quinone oxidoreductase subunit [Solirubrobacteraceae bacterium]